MVGALGVNQRWLFTSVFALGTFLAALGGALQMPHEPANLNLDLALIGEAFVVVVVGGMGSIVGAFVAAVLIAMVKAFCIAAGTIDVFGAPFPLSKLTLVAEFLVMAVVLVWRPWGLFGKPQAAVRGDGRDRGAAAAAAGGVAPRRLGRARRARARRVARRAGAVRVVLMIDVLIAVLFAASLHFLMGPAGMHSFGHAAYFGLGAYGAALCFKALGLPMEASLVLAPLLAALGAFVFGWFCVRLSGVYLAMLTLAFAQIVWSVVFQWDALTGGSNGLVGIWPAPWLAPKGRTTCSRSPARRRLRPARAHAARADRPGAARQPRLAAARRRDRHRRAAPAVGRLRRRRHVAGLAGSLFAFAKGTISPETLGVGKSVDGLVMVLLGGVQAVSGAVGRRRALHLAAGHGGAPDRLLARAARRRHARARARLPARRRRRAEARLHPRERERRRDGHALALSRERGLGKSFGGVRAVDDVSFELAAGEMLALIGPNGAGKTTCFNMVGGQLAPDAGSVRLAGTELVGLKPGGDLAPGRRPHLPDRRDLRLADGASRTCSSRCSRTRAACSASGARRARSSAPRPIALLASVGMVAQAERAMSVLAYGDVKRVELAIALANRPRLLLMDEPTAGMAPRERNELMALARRLAREQAIGVLFTEHSMDVVFAHADRIIVLARGELIAEGAPAAVRDDARVREVYFGGGTTFAGVTGEPCLRSRARRLVRPGADPLRRLARGRRRRVRRAGRPQRRRQVDDDEGDHGLDGAPTRPGRLPRPRHLGAAALPHRPPRSRLGAGRPAHLHRPHGAREPRGRAPAAARRRADLGRGAAVRALSRTSARCPTGPAAA